MANADAGGFVAVLVIDVHFPDAGSLKGKRKELSSLKAQLQTRLGLAVAETGHQDLWQRSTLTAALVSGDLATLRVGRRARRALARGAASRRGWASSGSSSRSRTCGDEALQPINTLGVTPIRCGA